MSDESRQNPDEEMTDDELVAFLDGELDELNSRAIEAQLAQDDDVRQRADSLKKTFDLLDYLPVSEPSPNFASRTLTQIQPQMLPQSNPGNVATVNPSISHPPQSNISLAARAVTRTGWPIALWSLILVVIAALGYFSHLLIQPHLEASDPAKRTSEQVRLLERLPLYIGVDDLDFLIRLEQFDLFPDREPDALIDNLTSNTLTSTELEQLENLFKTYPVSRQQALRKLDEELSQLPSDRQTRLMETLERYAVWLDRLPIDYRREVLSAPAAVERLETINIIKARLWRESLPAAVRERIQQSDVSQRQQLILDQKQLDTKRKQMWELARQEWANLREERRPWPFDQDELARQVEDYVEKVLKPRLSNNERLELEAIHKSLTPRPDWFKWFLYGNMIVRLNELHPMLPEPDNGRIVKSSKDLPASFLNLIAKHGGPTRRQLVNHPASGKWPDYAEAVAKEAQELKIALPFSLGPTQPSEYTPIVQRFYKDELLPRLTTSERQELTKLQTAAWPEHSKKMLEFARKYDLNVPGVTPPGTPSRWEKVYSRRPARK